MKKIIYIFFFLSGLYSSMLELHGTGIRYNNINAMGLGLGESTFFSDNLKSVSLSSIATYWKSNLTRISFSNQFSHNFSEYPDNDIRISSFSFTFPTSSYNAVSFGLSPYTRADIDLQETDGYFIGSGISDFADVINLRSDYKIRGGISSAYFVFSTKINNSFSLGFKIDRLFGNQFHTKKTFISSFDSFAESEFQYSQQDSTYKIVFNEFSGYKVQIDWLIDLSKHQIAFSAASMGPMDVNHRVFINEYTSLNPYQPGNTFLHVDSGDDLLQRDPDYSIYIQDDMNTNSFLNNILNRLDHYSIGYHYYTGKFGMLLEYKKNDLFNNPSLSSINLFNYNKPSTISYNMGLYKKYLNKKNAFWDVICLRIGGYYKELLFVNSKGADTAITMGFGIDKDSNLIDFGVKFGKLNIGEFQDENYIDAILSIEVGNRWFENSRSK